MSLKFLIKVIFAWTVCILFHTAICGLGLGLGLDTDGLGLDTAGLGTAGLDCKSGCDLWSNGYWFIWRVQRSAASDKDAACGKKAKNDLQSLSSREYLERTVVPLVMDGMSVLAKERWLANTAEAALFAKS